MVRLGAGGCRRPAEGGGRGQRRRGVFHWPRTGGRTGRVFGIAVAGLTPVGITGRGPAGGGVGAKPAARIGGRDERGGVGAGRFGTAREAGSTPAASCCAVYGGTGRPVGQATPTR